jgi:hypothetical protein
MVNEHQVKALFGIRTIEDNLMSEKFVSTNRIVMENLEVLIVPKIAVKGSRFTINYKAKPVIQIGSVR